MKIVYDDASVKDWYLQSEAKEKSQSILLLLCTLVHNTLVSWRGWYMATFKAEPVMWQLLKYK